MNGGKPEISVVTPLYNKAASIGRAVESVLAQTFAEFEMIIVDDGSTDDSAARVEAIDDPRITLVRQTNQGAAAARNHGVALARAAYVAFLDADDAWMPEFLSTIRKLIATFPGAGAYATGYFIKNTDAAMRPALFSHVPVDPQGGLIDSYFRVAARGRNPVWSSAVCIPKSTLDSIGGFPEGLRLYEDLYLWSRIAIEYPMAYCATPLAIYYRDAENRRGPVARESDGSLLTDGRLKIAAVIESAIEEGRLRGEDAQHASHFVEHYALLCGFKTVLAGETAQARKVVQTVRPLSVRSWMRKYLVLVLSYLPGPLRTVIWTAGKSAKRLGAGEFGSRA